MEYTESINELISQLTKLPSVGKRTAYRYAYALLNMPDEEVEKFASTILKVKKNIRYCSLCGNYSETDICHICATRDRSTVLVVSEPRDLVAIENAGNYGGVYHILFGNLSPRESIGPEDIRINELIKRLDGVNEVILATNPSAEGEVTAQYIARLIKPLGIKVSRIATGVPVGSHIEYADEDTLSRAINDRKPI